MCCVLFSSTTTLYHRIFDLSRVFFRIFENCFLLYSYQYSFHCFHNSICYLEKSRDIIQYTEKIFPILPKLYNNIVISTHRPLYRIWFFLCGNSCCSVFNVLCTLCFVRLEYSIFSSVCQEFFFEKMIFFLDHLYSVFNVLCTVWEAVCFCASFWVRRNYSTQCRKCQ